MSKPIFVFGSNLAGRHGKGDALIARHRHGAIYGQGEGLQGDSYGVPTKDAYLRPLSLVTIEMGVARFVDFAKSRLDRNFEVQALGCRLAGYKPAEIAPMFKDAPSNCYLHALFVEALNKAGFPAKLRQVPRDEPPPERQRDFGF